MIARVVARERGVDGYAMGSSHSIDFVVEFSSLDSELSFRRKWGEGSGGRSLWIGRRGQLFDIAF